MLRETTGFHLVSAALHRALATSSLYNMIKMSPETGTWQKVAEILHKTPRYSLKECQSALKAVKIGPQVSKIQTIFSIIRLICQFTFSNLP